MKRLSVLGCLLLLMSSTHCKPEGSWKWDGESSNSSPSTGPSTDATLVASASPAASGAFRFNNQEQSSEHSSTLNLAVAGKFCSTLEMMAVFK